MILSEYVKIKINTNKLKNIYSKYEPFKLGDIIDIKPKDLTSGSHVKIKVKCDTCDNENEMMYKEYIRVTKFDGLYYCRKCAAIKVKNTCIERYGVTNVSKSQTIIDAIKTTIQEKYGVNNIMNLEETRQKIKNVFIEKYGYNHPMKNKEFLKEFKRKNFEETGYETPFESSRVQEKIFKSSRYSKFNSFYKIYYQGSYEEDFLKLCKHLSLNVTKPKYIKYFFEGKIRRYFPDFYIKELDLIIEIKSNYYYKLHLEMNNLKKEYTIKNGFKHLTIIDKNYEEFLKIVS